jgi:hypothetical protein
VRARVTSGGYAGDVAAGGESMSRASDDPWRRIRLWRHIQGLVRGGRERDALEPLSTLLAEIPPEGRGPGYGDELVLALDLAARHGARAMIAEWLHRHGHRFEREPFLIQTALCLPAVATMIVEGELRDTVGLSEGELDNALAALDRALTHTLSAPADPVRTLADAEHPPLLRTDFSDDGAWDALCTAVQANVGEFRAYVSCISDPVFDGMTTEEVTPLAADAGHRFLFIADDVALTGPERPVLVVDLRREPGRTFRVIPSEAWGVENNLSIANMDFEDFADSVDEDGIFRGFRDA